MRRPLFALLATASFAAGGCAYLIGVTGDTEIAAPDASTQADATADVGVAPDAGHADAGAGRDAEAGTSGSLLCGAAACAVPENECCQEVDASTCATAGTACGGLVRACDDGTDCASGEVCCVTQILPKIFETTCKATCDVGEPQVCAGAGECGDAGACLPWRCGSVDVTTCGRAGADGGC